MKVKRAHNELVVYAGLCRHFRHSLGSLPLLNQPIGSLPLGTWRGDRPDHQLAMLKANAPLSTALELLNQGIKHSPLIMLFIS